MHDEPSPPSVEPTPDLDLRVRNLSADGGRVRVFIAGADDDRQRWRRCVARRDRHRRFRRGTRIVRYRRLVEQRNGRLVEQRKRRLVVVGRRRQLGRLRVYLYQREHLSRRHLSA
jgi:hypothetical protein